MSFLVELVLTQVNDSSVAVLGLSVMMGLEKVSSSLLLQIFS